MSSQFATKALVVGQKGGVKTGLHSKQASGKDFHKIISG